LEGIHGGDPLIPLSIDETRGERRLARFALDTLEDSVAAAFDHAHSRLGTSDRVAVAYDGFLTADSKRREAVLVRAAESTDLVSHIFAQRYDRQANRGARRSGNVAYLGHEPQF
jgi:hypothetical protein